MGVVVECSRSQVRDLRLASVWKGSKRERRPHMSETIPLGPALRVQRVEVVVGFSRGQSLDLVFERFSVEARDLGDIQG